MCRATAGIGIDPKDSVEKLPNPQESALGDGLLLSGDRPDQILPEILGLRSV